MKPHRFLLFGGMRDKPDGGWQDMINSSPTLAQARQDAIDLLKDGIYTWFHIVDIELGKIVHKGSLGGKNERN